MGRWVVELNGYDPGGAVAVVKRFAQQEGLAPTDAAYIPSGCLRWLSPTQKLDVGAGGPLTLSADVGEIQIVNAPDDFASVGPNDALDGYVWDQKVARLYWVPAQVWANKILVAYGVLQQPVITISTTGAFSSIFKFPLRDPRSAYDVPFQAAKYLGTGGAEGASDVKGNPKPVLYGRASNLTPVRVDAANLLYQVADKVAFVDCVRDGGAPLGVGTLQASLAALQAGTPLPGKFDWSQDASGTFIKLGSTPIFGCQVDAYEGTNASDRTPAQVWKRIRLERCGNVSGDIEAAGVTAVDGLDSAEFGFWWDTATTQKAVLDAVLDGSSCYEVLKTDATWGLRKLVAPSGTASIEFQLVTAANTKKAITRDILSLDRVRPAYMPNGVPPYRINLNWGLNYTQMNTTQFAGVAAQRLIDKFAIQWRTETYTVGAIWDPVGMTGPWPNAPELTVDTGYAVDSGTGTTCAGALAEATRLAGFLCAAKPAYQVGYLPAAADNLLPGAVAKLYFPQYGLSGGKLFMVLQAGFEVLKGVATAQAVLGMQT